MVPFVPLDMVLPISESAFLCPENRWTFIVLNSRQLRNFPYISMCFYLHFRLYARAHGPEVEVGGFQAWRMHFLSSWLMILGSHIWRIANCDAARPADEFKANGDMQRVGFRDDKV